MKAVILAGGLVPGLAKKRLDLPTGDRGNADTMAYNENICCTWCK